MSSGVMLQAEEAWIHRGANEHPAGKLDNFGRPPGIECNLSPGSALLGMLAIRPSV